MNSYLHLSLLLLICCKIISAFFPKSINELNSEAYEYETVSLVDDGFQYRSNDLSISFNTESFEKSYSLRLRKASDIFHPNFNLISVENGEDNQPLLKIINISTPSLFLDRKYNSVLHINRENNTLQAEGILTPELTIFPTSKFIDDVQSKDKHIIIKSIKKDKKNGKPNLLPASTVLSSDPDKVLRDLVTPELFVIVDYKNSKFYNFDAKELVKYLAIFWNAVNTRYALMVSPQVQLKIVNVLMVKDPKSQSYLEKFRVGEFVDYFEALPHLAEYMYKNANELPKYDIAIVMTGEDLAGDDGSGDYDNSYAGIAIVGGACVWEHENNLTLSVGIAEDTPPFYSGVLTHAHEVAHLLGAQHDGDPPAEHLPGSPGAELCPFSDGFIMSYKHGSKNKSYWSKCTMEQIRWFLRTDAAECLLENSYEKYVILNTTLPGELVSLNDQCRYLGVTGRAYNRQDKSSLCTTLFCENDEGEFTTIGPALEGTPCGYSATASRWCRDGECVLKD